MDSKIQELTEKIYNEGVLKGNAEAERILQAAKDRATQMETEAKEKADNLLRSAQRDTDELRQNTQSELKLYAAQLLDSLRASVVDSLAGEIASSNVQAMTVNPEFMQRLILELVQGFDPNKGVEIGTAQAQELEQYFASNAKHLLEQGVRITSVSGKPTDFTLKPADGGFKIQVGEAEFLELFKNFLRPQLARQLF